MELIWAQLKRQVGELNTGGKLQSRIKDVVSWVSLTNLVPGRISADGSKKAVEHTRDQAEQVWWKKDGIADFGHPEVVITAEDQRAVEEDDLDFIVSYVSHEDSAKIVINCAKIYLL